MSPFSCTLDLSSDNIQVDISLKDMKSLIELESFRNSRQKSKCKYLSIQSKSDNSTNVIIIHIDVMIKMEQIRNDGNKLDVSYLEKHR